MADRKAKTGATKKSAAKPAARHPVKRTAAARPVRKAAKAPTPKPAMAETAVSRKAFAAAERAFEATNQTIEQGNRTMNKEAKDTIATVKATQAEAANRIQAVFGDVNERAKTAMEKSTKVIEEMTELTKGNVEAIVASSKVAAKGVETLGQEAAEYSRRSFEEASAALKSFAEVKSATDFFRLQGDYARSAFDSLVAETSKMGEQMIKIVGDAAEPITSRYSVAAERVKNIAA